MADIYFVDFQRKTLIGKKQIIPDLPKHNLSKLQYFSELIERGLTLVVVNSRSSGVKLPPHLSENPAVEISWSHKFGLSDFVYDQFKISGTLSFDKREFHVELPWESIWLMFRPEEGEESVRLWKSDAPKEMLEEEFNEGETS